MGKIMNRTTFLAPVMLLVACTAFAACKDGDMRTVSGNAEICLGKQGWRRFISDKAESGSTQAARQLVPNLLGNLWTMVGQPEVNGDIAVIPATILNRSCKVTLRKSTQTPDGWLAENIDCKPI
jgi:hypothetical protein